MRRLVLTAALALFAAQAAAAQETTPKADVFGGYSYGGDNSRGWAASAAFSVNRWLGLAAEFGGQYTSFDSPDSSERIRTHSFLFGPRLSLRGKRVTPFVHALVGASHNDARAHELGFDFHSTDTDFAAELGGGLDININRRVAVRAFQLDYLRTNFFGGSQNNGRLAVGLVIRLGGKK
jgi:opacity protein-like surface antigen